MGLMLLGVLGVAVLVFSSAGTCEVDPFSWHTPAPVSTPYDVSAIAQPVPPGFSSWDQYIGWLQPQAGDVYTAGNAGADVGAAGSPEDLALATELGMELPVGQELIDIAVDGTHVTMTIRGEQLFAPDGSPAGYKFSGFPPVGVDAARWDDGGSADVAVVSFDLAVAP